MDFIGKKYKLISSENFDEFMKVMGVGLMVRKLANAVTPIVELRKEGDEYNLVTSSVFKTTEMKFKVGEEFDEAEAVGAKSVCTFEGCTLKKVQKTADGSLVTYIREFGPKDLKTTMIAKDVTCTRIYKAVDDSHPKTYRVLG
ncbi:unnamed protein product [Arctia plantaginis]|uniref:Cytosolic fatty-acid binding proteins domain-containing protein n=1 Tax=Arctia plantaginis TaxID=874455 RepID=A0A8S1ADC9_ARCPL|nr:unnamed protein product [Arctia plantaginis]